MTKNDCSDANSSHLAQVSVPAVRAPWTSPRVIVSDLGDARSTVSAGADGSSPSYGAYGS